MSSTITRSLATSAEHRLATGSGLLVPSASPLRLGREWPVADSRKVIVEHGLPHKGLPDEVNIWRAKNQANLLRGWRRIWLAAKLGVPTYYGAVYLTVGRGSTGEEIPYGLASLRVITTAGVNAVVDGFQGTFTISNFKYHAFGTGTTAEAVGDTALVTELTTQYNPDNTRPTGSQGEGATANVYRTTGTVTPDSGGTIAITEHALMSQAATGGGTCLDRSKFTAVNLDSTQSDYLTVQYDLTLPNGS